MPSTRKSAEVARRAPPIVPDWGEHRSLDRMSSRVAMSSFIADYVEDWFVLLMISFHCGDNPTLYEAWSEDRQEKETKISTGLPCPRVL
jgi:hypothetical protein